MQAQPFVSVILPVRNEEKFIEATLLAIAGQSYPSSLMEIIIADGMSTDSTREIVEKFNSSQTSLSITLLNNPEKIVPCGLNRAIRTAKGDVIVRMDSHSVYPANYVESLVTALDRYGADNTGGTVETVAYSNSVKCHAIAVALSHPVGVGNSYFRIGSSKVREVDTVPFGCFRRTVFDRIGLFDEELVRNQDDEFNGRMINSGMKIVMIPDITVKYFARNSFSKLYRMYYQYGLFKPLVVTKLGKVPTVRQLIPLLFVLFLLGGALLSLLLKPAGLLFGAGLIIYIAALTLTGIRQAVAKKMLLMTVPLVGAFFILHFSYGWGYLVGLVALLFGKKTVFKNKSLSR